MENLKKSLSYVCYTPFHVFSALVHSARYAMGKDVFIFIGDHASTNGLLVQKIADTISWVSRSFFHPDIEIYHRINRRHLVPHLNKIINLDATYRSASPEVLQYDPYFENSQIFLFHDSPLFSRYILQRYNEADMLEDGFQNYNKMEGIPLYRKVLKRMFGLYSTLGRDKRIKTIFVRFPELLPKEIQKKAQLFELQKAVTLLDLKVRDDIIMLFIEREAVELCMKSPSILLITQPLSESGFISEDEKIALYRDLLQEYKGLHIVIKPHPRELTDYASVYDYSNLTILPKEFPLEVLNYIPGVSFEEAVTLYSSAILNIDFVQKKRIIEEARFKELGFEIE